jgi:hypothetical protein
MISLFRKIRQKLLSDLPTGKAGNRVTRYLVYAAGEIFLVVIGILIALQVNNWNEERKSNNESIKLMQEINSEFTDNRIVLKERIADLENANSYVRTVLGFINTDQDEFQKTNMDSIISKSLKYGNYNPANSSIKELISSGRLKLVRDPSLKKNLFKWLQLLEDADEDFKNQDMQATTFLIPYLYKNIAMQNLNTYNNLGVDSKSALFNGDYHKVFKDLEFENLYQGKLFWNTEMLNHYKSLNTLALEIIHQTK